MDANTQIITTLAGNGTTAYCGDGGPASNACLFAPLGVAVDAAGNVVIADTGNQRIREVDAISSLITTIVGNGSKGFSGDGGLAVNAELNFPLAVAIDASMKMYVGDADNNRVRVVAPSVEGSFALLRMTAAGSPFAHAR